MCRPLSNFTTTDDQGHILTYDAWNRLIDVSNANGTDIENYAYDGAGHRITQGSPMVNPTQLYYDSSWQVVDEVTGAGGNMLHAQYVWSPVYSDALILRDYDFNNNGTFQAKERVYMTTDADFNVTGMVILISGTDIADALPDSGTDGSVGFAELLLVAQNYGRTVPGGDVVGDFNHDGTVDFADELLVAQAEAAGATTGTFTWVMGLHAVYSAFGDPTFYTYNFSATSSNFLAINYGPQGLYFDQNVGLAFADERARSLTEGTWLTVDPAQSGLNWYEDEADNPINFVDPMGLQDFKIPIVSKGDAFAIGYNLSVEVAGKVVGEGAGVEVSGEIKGTLWLGMGVGSEVQLLGVGVDLLHKWLGFEAVLSIPFDKKPGCNPVVGIEEKVGIGVNNEFTVGAGPGELSGKTRAYGFLLENCTLDFQTHKWHITVALQGTVEISWEARLWFLVKGGEVDGNFTTNKPILEESGAF